MKTIYLSGLAGTGKSTIAERVVTQSKDVVVLSYSDILRQYLEKKTNRRISHEYIRSQSSQMITPYDIKKVDSILLQKVRRLHSSRHNIIDSHAVTNEEYGYRATPFSIQILKLLRIDLFIVLYSNPSSISAKINGNNCGRIITDDYNLSSGINIQNSLVQTYGILTNKPVYYLYLCENIDFLSNWIILKLQK